MKGLLMQQAAPFENGTSGRDRSVCENGTAPRFRIRLDQSHSDSVTGLPALYQTVSRQQENTETGKQYSYWELLILS